MYISNRCETNCGKGLIPFHSPFDVLAAIILLLFLRQGSFYLARRKIFRVLVFAEERKGGMKNLSR